VVDGAGEEEEIVADIISKTRELEVATNKTKIEVTAEEEERVEFKVVGHREVKIQVFVKFFTKFLTISHYLGSGGRGSGGNQGYSHDQQGFSGNSGGRDGNDSQNYNSGGERGRSNYNRGGRR
jgi:hypothetical protein